MSAWKVLREAVSEPSTLGELIRAIEALLPNAVVGESASGEIIVETGLRADDSGHLVRFRRDG